MTAIVIAAYQRRLQEMAARLNEEVATLQAEALQTPAATAGGSAADQADPGALAGDEEVALALIGPEMHTLADVNAALDRIAQGVYGRCEACRRAISRERLDAVPHARHCIRCARQYEEGTAG